jgi:hypothetical protein
MHRSASAPTLGRCGIAKHDAAKGLPASEEAGLSQLLDSYGLGNHAYEVCTELGASTIWHLSLLSYHSIEAADLRPVVKGFLMALLFHPSHLQAIQDKKLWSFGLAQYAAKARERPREDPLPENSRVHLPPDYVISEKDQSLEQEGSDTLPLLGSGEEKQDLWGRAAPGLMKLAEVDYADKNYTGALKQYGMAIEWYEEEVNSLPPPNILIDMANCY